MNAGRLPGGPVEMAQYDARRLASVQEMYNAPAREQTLGDYWRILQKRKWTVLVSVIVFVIAAGRISLRMTPIYDATARISISQQASNLLNFKEGDNSQPIGNT